ncbi:DUF998 domain-containing protein [Aeromicrobium sp.]|uniref:DUF998 domain-containing protein n=1 Tax=Aeromicrobium sp. TaxID=1871063 RepID=UPI00199A9476|nr:DUF998 domain-containing protein [Aeromicrobium sp.]MBC7630395.1 DUF998 domain-containing protein [Aeromicrobium sp.]
MRPGAGLWVIGAAVWTMQPLIIALELIVGRRASASYSYVDNTISDLGYTRCRMLDGAALCSPWHALMNVGFVYFGCTLAIGALLLGLRRPAGRALTASMIAWSISGLGSIAVGLVPGNENVYLHSFVALPIFLAQPTALLLLGVGLLSTHPRMGRSTLAVAALSAIGVAVFFTLVVTDASSSIGAFERLALWPGYTWVSVVALAAFSEARSRGRG